MALPIPRLLVVDDDDLVRAVLQAVLAGAGYEVVVATSAAEALAVVQAAPVAVALVDLGLGDVSGIEVCRQLRAIDQPPQVIVMSGVSDADAKTQAQAAGALDLLGKPFTKQELLRHLAEARRAP